MAYGTYNTQLSVCPPAATPPPPQNPHKQCGVGKVKCYWTLKNEVGMHREKVVGQWGKARGGREESLVCHTDCALPGGQGGALKSTLGHTQIPQNFWLLKL